MRGLSAGQGILAGMADDLVIEAEGLVKRFGDHQGPTRASTSPCPRGHRPRRAGAERGGQDDRACGSWPRCCVPTRGRARVAGFDVVRDAERGPPDHRPHRPVRVGRRGPDRHAEPGADRHPARPVPAGEAKARAAELLEWFDLTDAADRPAKTYSGGMRRRLDLAASLVGRPSVIFLDEPTTGLDPAKREDMWEVVRGWSPRARPCCSPPSTWRRPTRWPTRSP